MRTIIALVAIGIGLLAGNSRAAGAQWAALEELNKRNIFFGEVEFIEAVERGDAEIVRIFLRAGMEPNLMLEGRWHPMHICALRGFDRAAQVLIAGGAWIDFPNPNGYTPLMLSAMLGHEKVAELLIESGADVNARSKLGVTPLILAVQSRHAAIAGMLLEAKADPNVTLPDGVSAYSLAIDMNLGEIKKLFAKHGFAARLSVTNKRLKGMREGEKEAKEKRDRRHAAKMKMLQEAATGETSAD